jgi:hypothetical protein
MLRYNHWGRQRLSRILHGHSRKLSWQLTIISIAVIALGVSAGTSFISASGELSVNSIWEHSPITWTQLPSNWCTAVSTTCPAAESGASMAYNDGNDVLQMIDTSGNIYSFIDGNLYWESGPSTEPLGGVLGETRGPAGLDSNGVAYFVAYTTKALSWYINDYTGLAWLSGSCTGGCYSGGTEPTPAAQGAFGLDSAVVGTSYYANGAILYGTDGSLWVQPGGYAPRQYTLSCTLGIKGGSTSCPTAVAGESLVYDDRSGYDVLFDSNGNTWELSFSSTALTATLAETVTAVSGSPGTCNIVGGASGVPCPQPRTGAGFAWFSPCGYPILFGGKTSGGAYLSDTWKYTVSSTSWAQVYPIVSPSARSGEAMGTDYADSEIALFGGVNSGGLLADAWTLSLSQGGSCP